MTAVPPMMEKMMVIVFHSGHFLAPAGRATAAGGSGGSGGG
jgi:hypothetical protein